MDRWGPPSLLDLASQSLLQDGTWSITVLEWLPTKLFPPLFMAAVKGRHIPMLKALVQAWPFTCLPLGALMKAQHPHHDIIQSALDGLDVLVAQKTHHRRSKLKVLDLRENINTNFWDRWSGDHELETVCTRTKMGKVDESRMSKKQPLIAGAGFINVCLKDASPEEWFAFLIQGVLQRKGLQHLSRRRLKIVAIPLQNLEGLLQTAHLECAQIVEVCCTWESTTLAKFTPHLVQFISQFLSQHQLQELYLGSVLYLEGSLDQLLRCLKTPLDTLWIKHCVFLESDLTYLSSMSHQSGIVLTGLSLKFFQILLERASALHLDSQ